MNPLLFSAGAIFIVGAIFWAGATYQRIGNIESRLAHIDDALGKLADVPTLIERSLDNQRRLAALERIMQERG